ncbi:ATP-dependent helicase HrpB [Lentisphaera profundi]|uniref:ATP-dependent helicase HrpB n=1 Tax=Lentisphaera profundi TaxID=1658616 RepID=A0ABY7VUA3_9BACT|nr:ATP-dependent helicase HrpB [Lentisphaera profundi]WDE97790.1 ATP-dependent helicase HrpB [Lentisphaera profundi]
MSQLPIHQVAEQVIETVVRDKLLLLSAPTGSGKSTCVPGILLDSGKIDGKIIVIQPRRAAAKFLAHHTAFLRSVKLGSEVGYSIRHDSKVNKDSKIIFMTDGLFLQQLKSNPQLKGIGAVLFDEFHERRWQMDLAFSLCRKVQEKQSHLHIMLMSATLDVDKLQAALQCPLITTEVRNFPVDIDYLIPDRQKKIWEVAANSAKKIMQTTKGSLLIFMPGKYEIMKTVNELQRSLKVPVHALHGQLNPQEQDRIIENTGQQKIIVSTNIAETSLTIPNITAVIDSGLVRQNAYDPQRQINTLYTKSISQSSAEQRAGRAGRTSAGQCLRLWSKSEQTRKMQHFEPEILRCDPSELLLQCLALGFSDLEELNLIDTPKELDQAWKVLELLGFTNSQGSLSTAGIHASKMPCSPRLAALLYYGTQADQMDKACTYAALISEPSIILNRNKKKLTDLVPGKELDFSSDLDLMAEMLFIAKSCKFQVQECDKYSLNANNCRSADLARMQFLRLCETMPRLQNFNDMHPHCCLLRAFPDYLAKRRDSSSLQVSLGNQLKGEIDRFSSQKKATLILATSIADIATSLGAKTKLSQLTAISPELLDHTFPGELLSKDEVIWDPSSKSARRAQQSCFRSLIIEEKIVDCEPDAQTEQVLANKIIDGTIKLNKWSEKLDDWIERVRKCAEIYPDKGIITYSPQDLEIVYMEMCSGLTKAKEVRDMDCLSYLKNLLSWDEQCFIEDAVPENIDIGNGKKLRIFYQVGKEIYVRAFIQQLFDLKKTPLIGPARIPLTFEILAPNHRPIQVTKNLENFWSGLYPEIKPALARRYHKHQWI